MNGVIGYAGVARDCTSLAVSIRLDDAARSPKKTRFPFLASQVYVDPPKLPYVCHFRPLWGSGSCWKPTKSVIRMAHSAFFYFYDFLPLCLAFGRLRSLKEAQDALPEPPRRPPGGPRTSRGGPREASKRPQEAPRRPQRGLSRAYNRVQ